MRLTDFESVLRRLDPETPRPRHREDFVSSDPDLVPEDEAELRRSARAMALRLFAWQEIERH